MRIRSQHGIDFHLAHQTHIQTNQVKFIDGGCALNLGKRSLKFIKQDDGVLHCPCQRRIGSHATSRCRVAPATWPAHTVVRHEQHVAFGRELLSRPSYKIYQGLGIAHVEFAQILNEMRAGNVEVIILKNEVTSRAAPITIARIASGITINLGNDDHLFG